MNDHLLISNSNTKSIRTERNKNNISKAKAIGNSIKTKEYKTTMIRTSSTVASKKDKFFNNAGRVTKLTLPRVEKDDEFYVQEKTGR